MPVILIAGIFFFRFTEYSQCFKIIKNCDNTRTKYFKIFIVDILSAIAEITYRSGTAIFKLQVKANGIV